MRCASPAASQHPHPKFPVQILVGLGRGVFWSSVALLIAQIIVHAAGPSSAVLTRAYHIFSAMFGATLAACVAAGLCTWAWRINMSLRHKSRWAQRKKRASQSAGARALVMLVILTAHTLVNSLVAADAHQYCFPSPLLAAINFFEWEGWNTLLLLMVIDGHSCVLVDKPVCNPGARQTHSDAQHTMGTDGAQAAGSTATSSAAVMDMGWLWHWPKLTMWLAVTGESASCLLCCLPASQMHCGLHNTM